MNSTADKSFPRTARAVEFTEVRRELAERCKTPLGRELCEGLTPAGSPEIAEVLLDETAEMAAIAATGTVLFPAKTSDPAPLISRIRKGTLPESHEIRSFLSFLDQAELMGEFVADRLDESPRLKVKCGEFIPLNELIGFFSETFESDGTMKPTASALLMDLESRINSLKQRIHAKAERILERADTRERFQDNYVTIRNDRLVLPVKAEYKNIFPGIIHGISSSDKTVFMEPQELVQENNLLQEAISEREAEIYRLMRLAAQMAMEHEKALLLDYRIAGEMDAICARTDLSTAIGGTRPLFSESGDLKILSLRHPLMALSGEHPVPNDLIMGPEERTLVISGPNAGGKTVMLKSVGLCVLMAGCGIFPPAAEGSRFPFVRRLYALAGDEQSIAEGESTFSAQLRGIKEALDGAAEGVWIIIDEILNGTDPAQASALSEAVLDYLGTRNCRAFVSTHLPGLKVTAQDNPTMVNAAMGFGPDNRPTFRLTKGHPGVSHPLDVASSIGIPDEILRNARGKLTDTQDRYQAAIIDLQKRSDELERRLSEARQQEDLARRSSEDLRARLADAQLAREEFEREKRKKLKEEVVKARETLQELVRKAREEDARARAETARNLKDMEERLVQEIRMPESVPLESLMAGEPVWIVALDRQAELVRFADNQRVEVVCGGARMTLKREEVIGIRRKDEAKPSPTRKADAGPSGPPEINLLGLTGEEAVETLDKFLDDQLLIGNDRVKIIHGRSVVRARVLDYLKGSPYIKSYSAAAAIEGGDAVTIALMKE